MNRIEELQNERKEALNRITEFLTPRINGEVACTLSEKNQYEEERAQLSKRIDEIEAEIQKEQAAEQRIEEGRQAVNSVLDNVDGIPLESLTVSSDAAIMIRAEVGSMVDELVSNQNDEIVRITLEHEQEMDEAETKAQKTRRELAELQQAYEKLLNENAVLAANLEAEERLRQQAEERAKDAEQKRDAAVRQLEAAQDLKEQNELLKAENERLKQGKVKTEAERTAEAEAARKRFLESRIKVVNVMWEDDLRKTHKLAERVDNGETVRFHYLEAGKYLEVTAEEAESFRLAQAIAEESPVEVLPEESVAFPVPPTLEGITQQESIGTEYDVENETVVFGGVDAIGESDPTQEASETAEHAETAPQAQDSEEVGETFEQWATREINELKAWRESFDNAKSAA